ncbi:tafazzin-like [Panonychus citri]|uniref:tafazzin-like n=1 Tax=Panonychus citri TaxID=50023 RepID=UPI00230724BB|nr:tafazzin-like [Panonychus citri]XP_053214965.1 tafazzin-like [Panonychus citri]
MGRKNDSVQPTIITTKWKPWRVDLFPLGKPLSSRSNLVKFGSAVSVVTVGLLSKLWTKLNRFTIVNHDSFLKAAESNYNGSSGSPLLTISNHSSCLDDPVLWGALLPWSWQFNMYRHRWVSAADDICFTKTWHTWFFATGNTFPIERGSGIYQPAIDFAVQLLKEKRLLHWFPQGRVAEESDISLLPCDSHTPLTLSDKTVDGVKPYHFKWGIGRLILEALETPDKENGTAIEKIEVLPFYHIGMNEILPNVEPYIPRIMKRVTIYIRKEGPIIFDRDLINWIYEKHGKLKSNQILEEKRIAISKFLEDEVKKIKLEAMKVHWVV